VFFKVTQQARTDNDAVCRVVQPDRNSVQGYLLAVCHLPARLVQT
jgi:hypothetical protein